MTSDNALRPLGYCEIISSSRHALGIYRRLANTCRYHIPYTDSVEDGKIHRAFDQALVRVLLQQPSLRVGIADEASNNPYFVRLDTINLGNHLAWTKAKNDAGLLQILEEEQVQLFPDITNRPPWKVVVVEYPAQDVLDVIFLVHHALCDGKSAALFHKHLLEALNRPFDTEAALEGRLVRLPPDISLVPSIEDMVNFDISWSFLLRTVWRELGPRWLQFNASADPWTGGKVSLEPNRLHLRKLEIDAVQMPKLLSACRSNGATLTGLIHALILRTLSRRLGPEQAKAFVALTPVSLAGIARPPSGIDLGQILSVAVTGQDHHFDTELVQSLRQAHQTENEIFEGERIAWSAACKVSQDLKHRVATLPKNDIVGLLRWMSDWREFWTKKIGKPRSTTWEVSNVGALQYNINTKDDQRHEWYINRSVFSQPVINAGPAICISIASVVGGALTLSVGWQDTIIEDQLAEDLTQDLHTLLSKIIESYKQK